MKITYYGHSCFTIASGGFSVAVDPYDKSVEGYPLLALKANKVYCSHGHFDHNYVQAVEIVPAKEDPFKVTEIEIPHDKEGGAKRGMNTIRIFEAEGKKIIHFGDTGCMPAEDVIETRCRTCPGRRCLHNRRRGSKRAHGKDQTRLSYSDAL